MSYEVRLTASFRRSVKKLKRRYPHIQDDIREGVELLRQTPRLGVVISGSGGIRKVRLSNKDAKRGKSGGYRLLYYLEDDESQTLYLLRGGPLPDVFYLFEKAHFLLFTAVAFVAAPYCL